MPSTFFGLNIGKSGLYTYQGALNTTAHNISNTDTEGYSRQQVIQQASDPLSVASSYGMQGSGVDIISIDRIRNEYYDVKYWENHSLCGEYDTKNYYMKAVENYISEVNASGLNSIFDDFNNALESLATDAGNQTMRTAVANLGTTLTDYMNYLSDSLKRVQREANDEIRDSAMEINNIVRQVASLNKQINTIEIRGEKANDLRDARTLLLDELSIYGNITVKESIISGTNTCIVKMDGRTVVEGYDYNELKVEVLDTSVNQNDAEGLYKLCWRDGQNFDSTSPTLGGKMQALFELRDGNNGENFKGFLDSISAGEEQGSDVVVKFANIQSLKLLNIPQYDGVVTVGHTDYEYSSVDIAIDPSDGTYTYTFHTKKEITAPYEEETTPVAVGESLAYKGIPYYQGKLNEFIRTYVENFNYLHNEAEDLDGNLGKDFFTALDPATGKCYDLTEIELLMRDKELQEERDGEDLTGRSAIIESRRAELEENLTSSSLPVMDEETETLKKVSCYFLTASNIRINQSILDDTGSIACAKDRDNGIEDVDVLKKIISLKRDEKMFKQGTPSMYIQSFTAEIAVDGMKASTFSENQNDILNSVDEQRMSISGVDQDEEAMNLVKFQHAYNLSSKVISTMNQIYDRLINYMGV